MNVDGYLKAPPAFSSWCLRSREYPIFCRPRARHSVLAGEESSSRWPRSTSPARREVAGERTLGTSRPLGANPAAASRLAAQQASGTAGVSPAKHSSVCAADSEIMLLLSSHSLPLSASLTLVLSHSVGFGVLGSKLDAELAER